MASLTAGPDRGHVVEVDDRPGGQRPEQREPAARSAVTDSSGSMSTEARGSSGPIRRGAQRSATWIRALRSLAASLNVRPWRRRASRRSRSSGVGSSSGTSSSSSMRRYRVFSSTSVAARSRNSVDVSRSGFGACVHGRLGLGQEGLDERPQAQPEHVELLAGDELGEQLEVALENGRVDLVRHGSRGYRLRRPIEATARGFGVSRRPGRDDRAGRLLAVSLSRPIVGAAAAGALLPPVAEAGPGFGADHGGNGLCSLRRATLPVSPDPAAVPGAGSSGGSGAVARRRTSGEEWSRMRNGLWSPSW